MVSQAKTAGHVFASSLCSLRSFAATFGIPGKLAVCHPVARHPLPVRPRMLSAQRHSLPDYRHSFTEDRHFLLADRHSFEGDRRILLEDRHSLPDDRRLLMKDRHSFMADRRFLLRDRHSLPEDRRSLGANDAYETRRTNHYVEATAVYGKQPGSPAVIGGVGEGPHASPGHPSGMPDSPHRTPVLAPRRGATPYHA